MVEKLIHWIPLINGRYKLNFDGLRVQDRAGRHLANVSIIIEECMALRDGVLAIKKTMVF